MSSPFTQFGGLGLQNPAVKACKPHIPFLPTYQVVRFGERHLMSDPTNRPSVETARQVADFPLIAAVDLLMQRNPSLDGRPYLLAAQIESQTKNWAWIQLHPSPNS